MNDSRSILLLKSLTKKDLRRQLREKRMGISTSEREQAGCSAAKSLIHFKPFQTSQHIGCYLARDDEFDTSDIIKTIWQHKKFCYLPVLPAAESKILSFVSYQNGDSLIQNRYRVLEPEAHETFLLEQLDLVFVPLLGFDRRGHRLGAGGGYYDSTFQFLLDQIEHHPVLVGVSYGIQQVDELPYDQWDVPLDFVLTENSILSIDK